MHPSRLQRLSPQHPIGNDPCRGVFQHHYLSPNAITGCRGCPLTILHALCWHSTERGDRSKYVLAQRAPKIREKNPWRGHQPTASRQPCSARPPLGEPACGGFMEGQSRFPLNYGNPGWVGGLISLGAQAGKQCALRRPWRMSLRRRTCQLTQVSTTWSVETRVGVPRGCELGAPLRRETRLAVFRR